MRPGLYRPGDTVSSPLARKNNSCFNEARAVSPGRPVGSIFALYRHRASMRPGLYRPGDLKRPRPIRRNDDEASMRPGLYRPGDVKWEVKMARKYIASFNEARAVSPGRRDTTRR